MATIKSYTDISQSKRLAEILPLESADMLFQLGEDKYADSIRVPLTKKHWEQMMPEINPCWSLAALMNLLPSKFTEKGKYSETTYNIDIRKYALTDDVDVYQIAYGNYRFYEDGNMSWKDMINTGEKENLIDACYEMILKLNEMNLL